MGAYLRDLTRPLPPLCSGKVLERAVPLYVLEARSIFHVQGCPKDVGRQSLLATPELAQSVTASHNFPTRASKSALR